MTQDYGHEDVGHDDAGRVDNGLQASAYVPLTDVDPTVGWHLLTALGRARIAAYLDDTPVPTDRQRLFVASDDRGDARTIVAAAIRALGPAAVPEQRDPLDDVDTDTAFRALVADWRVDTVAAVRDAERDLTREDAEWRSRVGRVRPSDEVDLDDEHYVPPPPPPLPRLARPTVVAMTVLALSILLLAFGGWLGLGESVTLVLGIGGLIGSAAILFTRVREHESDEDDDGSAV
jgi:hypothetical protein